MTKFIVLLAFTVLMTGCVTISDNASKVALYSEYSPLLDACQRMGSVSAKGSDITTVDGLAQSENNLRQEAYDKYRADAVAIVNIDKAGFEYISQGVAFKCG